MRIPVKNGTSYRYPDIIAEKGDLKIFVQIGKAKQNGGMIARELRAYNDLKAVCLTVFFPYN